MHKPRYDIARLDPSHVFVFMPVIFKLVIQAIALPNKNLNNIPDKTA